MKHEEVYDTTKQDEEKTYTNVNGYLIPNLTYKSDKQIKWHG